MMRGFRLDDVPGTALYNLLDAIEFILFLVPRLVQLLIDAFFGLGMLSGPIAMSLYLTMTYAGVAALLYLAWRSLSRCFWDGALVIGPTSVKPMTITAALLVMAAFTAVAPGTGLSLRHCRMAAASFVTFGG